MGIYEQADPVADIKHRLTNHPPKDRRVANELDFLTGKFIDLGFTLVDSLPDGREKSLALTKLEECSMWSKAALARNQEKFIEGLGD